MLWIFSTEDCVIEEGRCENEPETPFMQVHIVGICTHRVSPVIDRRPTKCSVACSHWINQSWVANEDSTAPRWVSYEANPATWPTSGRQQHIWQLQNLSRTCTIHRWSRSPIFRRMHILMETLAITGLRTPFKYLSWHPCTKQVSNWMRLVVNGDDYTYTCKTQFPTVLSSTP